MTDDWWLMTKLILFFEFIIKGNRWFRLSKYFALLKALRINKGIAH